MAKPSMVNSEQSLTLEQRRHFLKLPLEERRRQMAEQAAQMIQHYESPDEIQERQAGADFEVVEEV
jgi:hypothetical protein